MRDEARGAGPEPFTYAATWTSTGDHCVGDSPISWAVPRLPIAMLLAPGHAEEHTHTTRIRDPKETRSYHKLTTAAALHQNNNGNQVSCCRTSGNHLQRLGRNFSPQCAVKQRYSSLLPSLGLICKANKYLRGVEIKRNNMIFNVLV